jgi:hypothetical protein
MSAGSPRRPPLDCHGDPSRAIYLVASLGCGPRQALAKPLHACSRSTGSFSTDRHAPSAERREDATSTEYAPNTNNAWIQRFSDGNQNNNNKTNAYLVRPVRR